MRIHTLTLLAWLGLPAAAQQVGTLVTVGDPLPGGGHVTGIEWVQLDLNDSWTALVQTSDPLRRQVVLRDGAIEAEVGASVSAVPGASYRAFDDWSRDVLGIPVANVVLAGTAGGGADDEAILYGGWFQFQTGQAAAWPDFPPGTTWTGFDAVQFSLQAPSYLMRGTLDDPGIPGTSETFVAVASHAGSIGALYDVDVLAREGLPAPGLSELVEQVRVAPWAARMGRGWPGPGSGPVVLWSCDLRGREAADGCVFRSELMSGGSTLIAREGAASPVAGRTWGGLDEPALDINNPRLDWTLRADLDPSDPATDGLLSRNGAKLVQEGDVLAATAPFALAQIGAGPGLLDSNGRVLWYGRWNDPAPSARPEALFLDRVAVVRPGVTLVAGEPVAQVGWQGGSYDIAPKGEALAFLGTLDDGTRGAFRMQLGGVSAYCATKTSSLGCHPLLTWHGPWVSASAGASFVVRANDVLSQVNGLFFYGKTGPQSVPFHGGTLCVQGPIVRLPAQSSGGTPPAASACDGELAIDFAAWVASGLDPDLVPGQEVFGQFWYRDPGFAPPDDVGLSNAIRFEIQP